MTKFKIGLVLMLTMFFTLSCKKASEASNQPVVSNLDVTATVKSDGSGNVDFVATATNALSYTFEFGDGTIKTVPSGITTYRYTVSGSSTYSVTVTATGTSSSAKKTIPVTLSVTNTAPGLFWSEEFNTDGAPDASKWGYDLGNNNGWGNLELEYYTNRTDNAIVSGGTLKIKAIKENYQGFQYTSARLLTKDKFAFTFGRVEIRAKLPAGVGSWPALWMLGSNSNTVQWPGCGEIDIMEHRASELNKIFGTLHYPGRSGGNADGGTTVISGATTDFHIYKLDWTATYIKIYVDDTLVHTVANSSSIPFSHDFFLILNVAMGGTFAGAVDPAVTNATMEVDYIRVYK